MSEIERIHRNNLIYALIRNCVSIICFTVLAIHFEKWWISLFSALFLVSLEWKKG